MKRINLKYSVGIFLSFIVLSSCSKVDGYDFENGFSKGEFQDTIGELDDTDGRIDYSKFTQARLFPGVMSEAEPRLERAKVSIDLDYVHVPSSDLRISVTPGNWQSTGMYAPTGERIEIEVPEGIYGLTVQIGAHTSTSSSGIDNPQRDLVVYTRKDLFPGKNYVRNLYGGLIYILPSRPLGRIVDLYMTGVVKAPSFKLGVTDPIAWQEEIKKSTVPWFELEGNRIVFTIETAKAKLYGVDNPQELMETWDKVIKEAYWDWTGLTEGNPNPKHRAPFNKWRVVHDVLFSPKVAQVSGYPVRARNSQNYFTQATKIEQVKYSNWGTYHELGHNMQQGSTWSVGGGNQMGEVTNNLFNFKVSNLYGTVHSKIKDVWVRYAPQITSFIGSGQEWSKMYESYSGQHLDMKLMMYAQIFEAYGYEFMTHLYTRARNARFTAANDQDRYDFFYEALCEYTGKDMAKFLEMWGWKLSDVSKNYVQNELKLEPATTKLWRYNPITHVYESFRTDINRTRWTVSSSVAAHNNYPLTNMLDGAANTFWHIGSTKTFPYTITVVSPDDIEADGFYFQGRSGYLSRYLTNYTMEVRANSSATWEIVPMTGGTTLAIMNNDPNKVYIKFADNLTRTFREFRLTVKGANHSDVALAELGAFSDD